MKKSNLMTMQQTRRERETERARERDMKHEVESYKTDTQGDRINRKEEEEDVVKVVVVVGGIWQGRYDDSGHKSRIRYPPI